MAILAFKIYSLFDKLRNIFGGKKEDEPHPLLTDYSKLAVDLHSHLIPGIDDGAKTMDDSIFLLQRMEQLGFQKIITTPHVMADGYMNSTETILTGRDRVRRAMKENNIHLVFEASAEYNIDEGMYDKIDRKDLLPLGKNYVLVEMPFLAKPNIMGDVIYKLQIAGYNVVLAHPERYGYFYENDFRTYKSLKDKNVFFQINIASLTGTYGKGAKFTAEKMIDDKMVDFVGTDLHGARHLEFLEEALKHRYLEKIVTYERLLNKTLL